ncbi:MAG: hypothetical protein AAF558_13585 [Verrucomicrobiota bacterium]
MDIRTVLQATAVSQEHLQSLQMKRWQWSAYFALDGVKTIGELASRLGQNDDGAVEMAKMFLETGIAEEAPISMSGFLTTQGSDAKKAVETVNLTAFLTDRTMEDVASEESDQKPESESKPKPEPESEQEPKAAELELPLEEPKEDAPPEPIALSEHTISKMSLNSVIQFILQETGNPIAVYTTFLMVPSDLLKKNEIEHLPMAQEAFEVLIYDAELQEAIKQAVKQKLAKNIPDTVFK